MRIWFENMPFEVIWSEDALMAMNWNIQAILEDPSLKVEVNSGSVDPTAVFVKADVCDTAFELTEDQKLRIAKTIARFLKFHNVRDEMAARFDKKLEEGLEVIFVYKSFEMRFEWDEFKELV